MKKIVGICIATLMVVSMVSTVFAGAFEEKVSYEKSEYWLSYIYYEYSRHYTRLNGGPFQGEYKDVIKDENAKYSYDGDSIYDSNTPMPKTLFFPAKVYGSQKENVCSIESYSSNIPAYASVEKVIIENGIQGVYNSFSNFSNLQIAIIPESVTNIEYSFRSPNVTIYGKKGSYAEQYANENNIAFKDDSSSDTNTTETRTDAPAQVLTSFGATVSEWAAPEIEEAFENNLIPEVMLDFDLTKKVNRGEFAAIAVQLYEVLAKRSVEEAPNCTFADIQYDDNEEAIKKAYQIEVAQGTSTTTYEPLSFINREQLATMLCRVIKKYSFPNWTMENDADYYMDTTGVQKFADDIEISEWAKPSVYFMSKFGIIKGINDTHFAPKNTTSQQEASGYATATREQAIILAQRIFTQSDLLKIN